MIGVRHIMPGESAGAFDSFCSFGAIETLIPYLHTGVTLRTTNLLNFSILMGVLGVSLLAGRAFCGWMCPLGALQDLFAGWARRLSGDPKPVRGKKSPARFPIHLPVSVDSILRYLKYFILGAILATSVVRAIPPLYSICPVRAFFGLHLTWLLGGVLLAFTGLSLLVERGICKYLCPLGALLAVFNKIAPLRPILGSGCNSCGRCSSGCPMEIQEVPMQLKDLECVRCLDCVDTCARQDGLVLKIGE